MAEQAERGAEAADAKNEIDEHRIARGVAIGLPLVTATMAAVTGVIFGAAMAILVLAAGGILGVIALLWASLRILSGDAELPPELAALEAGVNTVDALASRKKMLLRALKDLDVEHALGKLDDDDREQIAKKYRDELKDVMKEIDASLEPLRPQAEEAAKKYLAREGLATSGGYRGVQPEDVAEREEDEEADDDERDEDEEADDEREVVREEAPPEPRPSCAKCKTKNESDAAFCKKCGAPLKAPEPDEGDDDATDTKESA